MAWSFRKRIKIIPGVHLNLSKSGISTSIGVKGASMTFGKSGVYLNTGIPVLDIYNRQKLFEQDIPPVPHLYNEYNPVELTDNIFSADIHEITSQNMQGVKEAIMLAHHQKNELGNDLLKIKATLGTTRLKRILSYIFIYGLIKKTIPENLKMDIEAQQEAIRQTKEAIDNCYVNLDVDFDPEIKEKYNQLVNAFRKLTACHKIWDVTSAHFQDRVAARSSASTIVNKRNVRFALSSISHLKSNFETLYFQNANGADLYFYPGFIIMYSNKSDFAIIGIDEINLERGSVRFTETGSVPPDSKIIDHTWAKVNKNGTPDKRFKDNYQIPIVKYGEIRLSTNTGLNEEYEFSNYEFTEEFGKVFNEYQTTIKRLNVFNLSNTGS
ncbi:hypothetical protein TH53_04315 [Pedobacter lusitanus]|uniref:DUF4236 domain-containing protein n=1 Tax=Pedobacter lusitanus TaxID=1503925 RepID=A0A0D0F931_9SPHI|nr:DUF4236 domain-containing protein [Pedobacter lusitanus]KIO78248.1 hypothetical protein TH53_04315 [Pedobacter lusitanus]